MSSMENYVFKKGTTGFQKMSETISQGWCHQK